MENPTDYKTCSKQESDTCFKTAHKDKFRAKSKECKNCYNQRMTAYYAAHKEVMKQQSRIANNKRYIPRPKRVKKKPNENIDEDIKIAPENDINIV